MDQWTETFDAAPGDLLEVAKAFEELEALLGAAHPAAFEALVKVTVDRVPGAQSASITTLTNGTFQTVAATDDRAMRADAIQYELGSGPCVDAIIEDAVYRPGNLATDPRWPDFARRASDELGVASMLSYRLQLDSELAVGGLNIYSDKAFAFDDEAVMIGLLLATHGSRAVSAALLQEQVANLQRALETNRDIGTAIGILMSRHRVSRQQAFNLLAVASQHSNRKISDIASEVLVSGTLELPGK
jgi:ANTAR domain